MIDIKDTRNREELLKALSFGLGMVAAAMGVVGVAARRCADALQEVADHLDQEIPPPPPEPGEQAETYTSAGPPLPPPPAPHEPLSPIEDGVVPGVPLS